MRTIHAWALAALTVAVVLGPIEASAARDVTVYNGSGVNPIGLSNLSGPFIGYGWGAKISGVAPGSASLLVLGLGGAAPPGLVPGGIFGLGELLCLPPHRILGFSADGTHHVSIPADYSLVGVGFCVQGVKLDMGAAVAELQNALVGTIAVDCCFFSKACCAG